MIPKLENNDYENYTGVILSVKTSLRERKLQVNI